MKCITCYKELEPGQRFCEDDGTPVEFSIGTSQSSIVNVCHRCSTPLTRRDADDCCQVCGTVIHIQARDHLKCKVDQALVGVTDRGRKHHENQDDFRVEKKGLPEGTAYAIVVCDGVSSSKESRWASAAGAKRAMEELLDAQKVNENVMSYALSAAHHAVVGMGRIMTKGGSDLPSSTIVTTYVLGNQAVVGWIGDSRAYLLSKSGVRALTHDDSWVNEVIGSGEMTKAEAEKSRDANAITQWLGMVDRAPTPHVQVVDLAPEDTHLVVCSDGLWKYLDKQPLLWDWLLKLFLQQPGNPAETIADRFVEYALLQGGSDNVSVCVLDLNARV